MALDDIAIRLLIKHKVRKKVGIQRNDTVDQQIRYQYKSSTIIQSTPYAIGFHKY